MVNTVCDEQYIHIFNISVCTPLKIILCATVILANYDLRGNAPTDKFCIQVFCFKAFTNQIAFESFSESFY